MQVFYLKMASAPKKFSFSLSKNPKPSAAQAVPPGIGVKREGQTKPAAANLSSSRAFQNGRGGPSAVPVKAFGFDAPGEATEAPKVQALLSISGGQLEVEGGSEEAKPRVIPCKNPLPLSSYRVRITDNEEAIGTDWKETENTAVAGSSKDSEEGRSKTSLESQAPLWGLNEMKRGAKKEAIEHLSENKEWSSMPPVKTKLCPDTAANNQSSNQSTYKLKIKIEPISQGRVTDEEAATSLLAEARGESFSARVVPLLARNSVLAKLRQKYRKEVEGNRRQQQQAGEPDKALLQRELALLPDAPTPSSSAYETMPVGEFGAAMLRGMGLKSIPSAPAPIKRKAYTRSGLGSEREIDRLRERLEQRRKIEDAAEKGQKTFIPLKTDRQGK